MGHAFSHPSTSEDLLESEPTGPWGAALPAEQWPPVPGSGSACLLTPRSRPCACENQGECETVQPLRKTVWQSLKKLNTELLYDCIVIFLYVKYHLPFKL